jgi:hypothetical protein
MNRVVLGLTIAMSCAFGCGEDGDDGDRLGGDGGARPDPVAETIEASEGGGVEIAGGAAAVAIPADALDEDTEITIEVVDKRDLPKAAMIASEVYDFGPDGTLFDEPVTLTIEFDAGDAPDGMSPVLAWLDSESDEWQPLADSTVRNGAVTASTDHFTPFAVIWTVGGQVGGQCGELGATDCGGDLVGTWEFMVSCLTLPEDFLSGDGGEDPFAECGGATLSAALDLTGTITFDEDGSYSSSTMQTSDITISVPKECLMGQPCSELGDEENPAAEAGDNCELQMSSSESSEDTGTYELEGNTLITINDEDMIEDEPSEYCVRGDTLLVRTVDPENGTESVVQATRQ